MQQSPIDPDSTAAESALPVDALVSSMAQVIFVTTGPAACATFGEAPVQIALTPMVAERMACALRDAAQYPDLGSRQALLELWQSQELQFMPHGRILASEAGVHVCIEPLGAGEYVGVRWEHVPALIWQLEWVVAELRMGR